MYQFGSRSMSRLNGVHPDLIRVVNRALELSPLDFAITEGLRSLATQRKYVTEGKSQTMNSRHITGHAVDVVVLIAGKPQWALQLYTDIAGVFGKAADELGIPVVWGGCWVKVNGAGELDDELAAYIARRKAEGRRPFIDGPHFELARSAYPA
jgi:peptidoglycan L-alanyl-D-glutamate endopeptidase CwlK